MKSIPAYEPLRHRYDWEKFEGFKARLKTESVAMIERNRALGMSMSQNQAALMAYTMRHHYAGMEPENISRRERLCENRHNMYTAWRHTGKTIYDCAKIAPLFAKTDVADAPFENLTLPFDIFYVHFGPDADLEFEPGRYIEGCYVVHTPQTAEDPEGVLALFHSNYRDLENRDKHSIGFHLREKSAVMRAVFPYGQIVGARSNQHDYVDGAPELTDRADLVVKATNILVNFLFYLSLDDAELDERYPDGAPERLVALAPTKPKARRQLETLGYTKITMVGHSLAATYGASGESRGGVAPHWRRGHWRHYLIGPGRTGRKRRWLKPMQINKSAPADPQAHVYVPDLKAAAPETPESNTP